MMTVEAKLDSISKQIAQLLQHVEEVRRTNVKLVAQYDGMQGDMKSMQGDIRSLDEKIDKNTEFLAGKMEHHVRALREETTRDRTRFEEEGYIRSFRQQEIKNRLDDVEARVARLEAKRPLEGACKSMVVTGTQPPNPSASTLD